eukprot:jgi/Tetstr1/462403/TSEL_007409.t1
MASPATAMGVAAPAGSGPAAAGVSWWRRYTRWRQTSQQEAVAAERQLMAVRGDGGAEAADVPLSCGNTMHTLSAGQPSAPGPAPLVCVSGYGAGAGFFWKNIGPLAADNQVLAVDLLGTGLSSRPAFTAKDTAAAEDFFVSSLSDWRRQMGLDKMILVAHSMGGYLATVYALRHPEHVQHLVLVSPAAS